MFDAPSRAEFPRRFAARTGFHDDLCLAAQLAGSDSLGAIHGPGPACMSGAWIVRPRSGSGISGRLKGKTLEVTGNGVREPRFVLIFGRHIGSIRQGDIRWDHQSISTLRAVCGPGQIDWPFWRPRRYLRIASPANRSRCRQSTVGPPRSQYFCCMLAGNPRPMYGNHYRIAAQKRCGGARLSKGPTLSVPTDRPEPLKGFGPRRLHPRYDYGSPNAERSCPTNKLGP